MRRCFQFSLRTLLWLTLVVAAFCAGSRCEHFLAELRPDPTEKRIWTALNEKTELDFAEQPLSDVIDYLRQRHDIEIQLDNKALADAGVGSDTPVTRAIKGITPRSALKLILGELDLTYVVDNGIMSITTINAAYPWLRFKNMLWLMAVVASFWGGVQFARKLGRQQRLPCADASNGKTSCRVRR